MRRSVTRVVALANSDMASSRHVRLREGFVLVWVRIGVIRIAIVCRSHASVAFRAGREPGESGERCASRGAPARRVRFSGFAAARGALAVALPRQRPRGRVNHESGGHERTAGALRQVSRHRAHV